jgi:DNA-binding transcriptional regulator PaaX
LRRSLRDKGFGCPHYSVWITPDPMEAEREILGGGKINVESLLLPEARPCAGESDMEIVAGAWDFDRINRRHARHLKVLKERPGAALRSDAAAKALRRWAATEREAWLAAVRNDPLLPARLLPLEYPGQEAWRRRMEAFRHAGRQLRAFQCGVISGQNHVANATRIWLHSSDMMIPAVAATFVYTCCVMRLVGQKTSLRPVMVSSGGLQFDWAGWIPRQLDQQGLTLVNPAWRGNRKHRRSVDA